MKKFIPYLMLMSLALSPALSSLARADDASDAAADRKEQSLQDKIQQDESDLATQNSFLKTDLAKKMSAARALQAAKKNLIQIQRDLGSDKIRNPSSLTIDEQEALKDAKSQMKDAQTAYDSASAAVAVDQNEIAANQKDEDVQNRKIDKIEGSRKIDKVGGADSSCNAMLSFLENQSIPATDDLRKELKSPASLRSKGVDTEALLKAMKKFDSSTADIVHGNNVIPNRNELIKAVMREAAKSSCPTAEWMQSFGQSKQLCEFDLLKQNGKVQNEAAAPPSEIYLQKLVKAWGAAIQDVNATSAPSNVTGAQ